MNERTPHVDVIVEDGVSAEDQDAIRAHLEEQGLSVTLSTTDIEDFRQGIASGQTAFDPGVSGAYNPDGYRWGVMLHARVNELAREAGAEKLRAAIDGLRQLRAKQTATSPGKGIVMLVDEDTGIRLDMEFQLPLSAYEALGTMRFATFDADPLSFHRKAGPSGRWRAPR